jgi:hypothetical protein
MRPHDQIPDSVTLTNNRSSPVQIVGLISFAANEANKVVDLSKYSEAGVHREVGKQSQSWKSKIWHGIAEAEAAGTLTLESSTPATTIGPADLDPTGTSPDELTNRPSMPGDRTGPILMKLIPDANSAFVDLIFSKGVHTRGGGAFELADLSFTFSQNGGDATAAAPVSVKQNDDPDEATASALVGDETVVRLFLNVTGTPSGTEIVTVELVAGAYEDNNGAIGDDILRRVALLAGS